MTVLADFIFLGHDHAGSWALSSDKTELFAIAIGAFLDIICETFNSQGIPQLIDINGEHFSGITEYPRMTHGDIEDANITEVASFIKDMTGIGVLVPDDGLEDYIRQVGHLPERTADDRDMDERRKEQQQQNQPPETAAGKNPEEQEEEIPADQVEAAKKRLGRG
jgi:phage gp29-like protein